MQKLELEFRGNRKPVRICQDFDQDIRIMSIQIAL